MDIRTSCVLALSLLGTVTPAWAGIRPSFNPDYSSWHSTDIVVVSATEVDGTFTVVESWKGDLRPSDRVEIPELKPNANAVPISQYPEDYFVVDGDVSTNIPKQITGTRCILFIKRVPPLPSATPAGQLTNPQWQASNLFKDMKASAVWVDGDRLYRFAQMVNPGPSKLVSWEWSEVKLRERVSEVIRVQNDLTRIAAIVDGSERAAALKPYVQSAIWPAQMFADAELGNCGPRGVPVIRAMLDDGKFAVQAGILVEALVRAGGAEVGKDLTARLAHDLEFWRAIGPRLRQGWWNDDPTPEAPLRNHYAQTLELIRGLDGIRFSGALSTATAMRDFWRSLPQLDDPSGLKQMSEESDKLVRDLQIN